MNEYQCCELQAIDHAGRPDLTLLDRPLLP
jgi:hypothetical protein